MNNIKISKKFRKISEIYKIFGIHPKSDFSQKALEEAFIYESMGIGDEDYRIFSKKINGYVLGKKWLNVTISMWYEDIKEGILFEEEVYADGKYPKWWLDKIFNKGKI